MSKAQISAVVINARAIAALDAHVASKGADALAAFRECFANCDVPTYNAKRKDWVTAYDAARGTEGGAKRFSEIVRAAGVVKPQTAAAAAKQAKRKASGAGKAGTAADKRTRAAKAAIAPVPQKAGDGAAAAKRVKMELSAIEAHLIGLIRAGKFVQAAECVASMAPAK